MWTRVLLKCTKQRQCGCALSSHLSFERGDRVLQFLSDLCWHQTFDLLLILSTYSGHLMRHAGQQNAVSELSEQILSLMNKQHQNLHDEY